MRKYVLAACVATLALVVAAPAMGSSHARPADAHVAKKKCKKKKGKKKCKKKKVVAPPATPAPPTPLALTAAEVVSRVQQKANEYCNPDPACVDWGYYWDTAPGDPYCDSRSTYTWVCYGYNYEYWPGDDPETDYWWCDFREIVERDGYNGIKSHQDPTYGGAPDWAPGWFCYPDDF
jgi:hypothetical protein